MKKNLFLLLSVMPLGAYAQYQRDTTSDVVGLLTMLFVLVVIFLVCREIVCWYWKINKQIKNQERIIELLESINQKLSKQE